MSSPRLTSKLHQFGVPDIGEGDSWEAEGIAEAFSAEEEPCVEEDDDASFYEDRDLIYSADATDATYDPTIGDVDMEGDEVVGQEEEEKEEGGTPIPTMEGSNDLEGVPSDKRTHETYIQELRMDKRVGYVKVKEPRVTSEFLDGQATECVLVKKMKHKILDGASGLRDHVPAIIAAIALTNGVAPAVTSATTSRPSKTRRYRDSGISTESQAGQQES
ncbi:hypothetical protein C8A03DRAFT_37206 [Achaetomium macrosporum]|uniref:Uncharacterized protein n=1 Tax=Achaetomium macrosporum TaxID=79813 RepID=A0AAN7C573_9PEZI|nr:hypothetical protein C8A03DRAFT_37206 [Achaetomium macrosporum]